MTQDSRIRFVFFGSDDFSIAVLDVLAFAGFYPTLVVTVPDKPKGRRLILSSPPVKTWADEHTIPVIQPTSLSDSLVIDKLKGANCRLFIVASFGKIIPKSVLEIPKLGALNVHPSLLPKFRGASPIESAILSDDKRVGVTIMLMDEKMDHGPIVAQRQTQESIFGNQEWPTSEELQKVLAKQGGELLTEILPKWVEGKIEAIPQNEAEASYTKKFSKEDAFINLSEDSRGNYLKIRAFSRSPVAYTTVARNGRLVRLIIKSAELKDGLLVLKRVIPEGKREMSYDDFLRGFSR